jgi:hypothetical protein
LEFGIIWCLSFVSCLLFPLSHSPSPFGHLNIGAWNYLVLVSWFLSFVSAIPFPLPFWSFEHWSLELFGACLLVLVFCFRYLSLGNCRAAGLFGLKEKMYQDVSLKRAITIDTENNIRPC